MESAGAEPSSPPKPPAPHPHTPRQSLVSFVRSKAHKRRATASLTWTLGGGLTCAVKMFQTVQAQKVPAVRWSRLRAGSAMLVG